MQEIIEDAVRGVGHVTLRVVTIGRYRGGRKDDRLSEGAIGLAIVAVALWAAYAMAG